MSMPAPDCCHRPHDVLTGFDAARALARAMVRPTVRHEIVPLAAATGRILARPIVAPHALPPFDQAAMDGYAIRLGDGSSPPAALPLCGTTEAGDPSARLAPGTAHGVMTGGALPEGADTVVMIEATRRIGGRILFEPGLTPGSHIRRSGEDVAAGAIVAHAGDRLGWAQIGLLAALGIGAVCVATPIRIAVLTTGSELRPAGSALSGGTIHDSNGPMLAALLGGPGVQIELVTVPDDRATIAANLASAARVCDLVVTTAGMSVGGRDHVRDAVADSGGTLDMVKVAMKPGKPLALGRLGAAIFVGLPGNPQAVACGALAFLRPMIDVLAGRPPAAPLFAAAAFAHGARTDRRTALVPVRLSHRQGRLIAEQAGPEGSHRLAPLAAADAVAVVPPLATLMPGALVEVLPFDAPGTSGGYGR